MLPRKLSLKGSAFGPLLFVDVGVLIMNNSRRHARVWRLTERGNYDTPRTSAVYTCPDNVCRLVLNFNYLSRNSRKLQQQQGFPQEAAASSFSPQNRRDAAGRRTLCTHLLLAEARTNASRQTKVLGSRHQATLRREKQDRRGREHPA